MIWTNLTDHREWIFCARSKESAKRIRVVLYPNSLSFRLLYSDQPTFKILHPEISSCFLFSNLRKVFNICTESTQTIKQQYDIISPYWNIFWEPIYIILLRLDESMEQDTREVECKQSYPYHMVESLCQGMSCIKPILRESTTKACFLRM